MITLGKSHLPYSDHHIIDNYNKKPTLPDCASTVLSVVPGFISFTYLYKQP